MYVCICNGVNEKMIQDAVIHQGAESLRDVRRCMALGDVCGKCVCHAAEVVKQARDVEAILEIS